MGAYQQGVSWQQQRPSGAGCKLRAVQEANLCSWCWHATLPCSSSSAYLTLLPFHCAAACNRTTG